MSKIIKASRITGEYKLSDIKIENKKKTDNNKSKNNTDEQNDNKKVNIERDKILKEAKQKADDIISEAKNKASKIVEKAEEKAEKIKEEAEKEGYDNGYQTGKEDGHKAGYDNGYQEAKKEFNKKLEEFTSIIDKTENYLEEEIERLPAEVIDLSLSIASKIVNKEVNLEPGIINNIIYDILDDIGAAHEDITIKVSPDIINYINEADLESAMGQQTLEFVTDSNLNPGDCVVETEFGGKDATIANKLELIEDKLYQGADYNEES